MALATNTIATAIAALSISGVTIKDVSAIPQSVDRLCPVLFPDPSEWLTGYSAADEGLSTFGVSGGLRLVTRTLHYIYAHVPTGSGRANFEYYPAMNTAADSIIETIFELNADGVDILNVGIERYEPITDPAGTSFFGFRVAVTVREKLNA